MNSNLTVQYIFKTISLFEFSNKIDINRGQFKNTKFRNSMIVKL